MPINASFLKLVHTPLPTRWKQLKSLLFNLLEMFVTLTANPVTGFLIVGLQLFLGAMVGLIYSSVPANTPDFMMTMWQSLSSDQKMYLCFTVVASLLKAGGDALNTYFIRKKDTERRENDRLIPAGKWFATFYAETVRNVIDSRYMIESNQREPLTVMQKTLENVRDLAAQYDNSANDSFSVNLMLSFRTDEVEDEIEENWNNCQAFFDGSNAQSAISQIDGILTPIAVAHADKKSKLYIGSDDIRANPLLLPIVDGKASGKNRTPQRVIGAPKAFTTGRFQYYGNFLVNVEEWLYKEQRRVISTEQADTLYKYYINDGSARSLLSVPIQAQYTMQSSEGEELEDKPINLVLNIYASHENLLRGDPQVFLGLVQPLLDTIAFSFDSWSLALKEEVDTAESQNDGKD